MILRLYCIVNGNTPLYDCVRSLISSDILPFIMLNRFQYDNITQYQYNHQLCYMQFLTINLILFFVRVLKQELICEDVRLQKLLKFAKKSHIKLIGQCRRNSLSKIYLLQDVTNLFSGEMYDNPCKFDTYR